MRSSAGTRQSRRPDGIGALIVGGDHPGLGVARSLGRRGIPTIIIDDRYSIAAFSRYTAQAIRVKDLRDERKTVQTVLEIGKRLNLRNWVLFPTRDETVAAFSRYRAELTDFFNVTTPEWDTIQWVWNKKNTYDLACKLGIPHPKTYSVCGPHELASLYDKLPLAIKPAVKENFFYATGAKAWRAETLEQLQRLYAEARKHLCPEQILIQEIIPGNGDTQMSYCAFYQGGRPHSSLVAKRARQHPREFGRAATYVETIESREVEELSERFLEAIDYYGLVEIEYKKDPRDGLYKILDVNARTWGFHTIGFPAGIDFPYLLFADQVGEQLAAGHGQPGIGWLRLLTDVPTAALDLLLGHLSLPAYFETLRKARIESVFSVRDPLPGFAEIVLAPYLIAKKYW